MYALFVAWLIAAASHAPVPPAPSERAAFVTTLGRDTVVVESVARSGTHVDGYIVVRVPGTVLCHYTADLGKDGTVTHTVLEIKPLGTSEVHDQRVTMDFDGGKVHITADAPNGQQSVTRDFATGGFPFFMTGFGSSYGLYSSLGMYELFLPRVLAGTKDTVSVQSIDMATARTGPRQFVRRSPTAVTVDYFGVGWTTLTVDGDGHITDADATAATTEKTLTHRADFVDVQGMAKTFAAADKAGKGLGTASPNQTEKGSIAGTPVVVTFGSPRKRGRDILGNVVSYDRVWRTGANEATTISFARDVAIGGQPVPAGTYSLWTIPTHDGTVQLIVNRQHGQWGTDYDAAQDLFHVPMHVTTASTPREDFVIDVPASGNAADLRMSWDTFVWTVPITAK